MIDLYNSSVKFVQYLTFTPGIYLSNARLFESSEIITDFLLLKHLI